MQFVTIRDFRNKSGMIQRLLPQEKEIVLTSNGKPIAILSATSAEKLEETLTMMRRTRAVMAVEHLQTNSEKKGASGMPLKSIEEQIKQVRGKRRAG